MEIEYSTLSTTYILIIIITNVIFLPLIFVIIF